MNGWTSKQDCLTAKDPCPPPRRFLYLRKTKSWWCGEGEEGEKVSLKTLATTRGMGKNMWTLDPSPLVD